jgi:Chaperone of endosialidase
MKNVILFFATIFYLQVVHAQNIGIGTTTPDSSAVLDVSSNNKGLLLPRLTTIERNAIANPAKGLMVYGITDSNFYMYDGAWRRLIPAAEAWSTKGNVNASNNFIGTTDNNSLKFRINNTWAGQLDSAKRNVSLGLNAGAGIGNGSIAIGNAAAKLNTGASTVAIGDSAGYTANSSGSAIFIGTNAGRSYKNTTAAGNNIIIGNYAGDSAIASETTIIGNFAGRNNQAAGNVFIGNTAGYNNTTGESNNFNGYAAGLSNTIGGYNIFNGSFSGYNNTVGSRNIFIGFQAGYRNTTGSINQFTGYAAGYNNTTGSENYFSGYTSGIFTSSGSKNYFSGNLSGTANTAGSKNTMIGYNANPVTVDLNNAAAIGYNAKVSTSNSFVLGGTGADAVNVGIGTTAPSFKLDVVGRMRIASLGNVNNTAGIWLNNSTNASTVSFVGMYDDNNIGFFSTPASSWNFVSNINTGNVGIGIGGPSGTYKLQVGGSCAAVSFVTISDARYKKNIRPIQNALTTLLQLNAKTYNWNKADFPKNNFDDKLQMGFIAQEVEKVLPAIVTTDAEGYKAVNYIQVIPLLMQGIKEQQIKINELEARSNKLEKELVEIKKILLQKTN